MKPLIHAAISAARYGAEPQDYLRAHDLPDVTKAHFASMQHRAFFHSDFGLDLAERILGATYRVLSTQTAVRSRDLLVDHITEDLGMVPPIERWFARLDMSGLRTRRCRPDLEYLREDAPGGAAAKYGGIPADYAAVVTFFDSPATYGLDEKRSLFALHHSFGIYVAEMLLGVTVRNSAGKNVCVRTIGEDLVQARTGYIPSFGAILNRIPLESWMLGSGVAQGLASRHRAFGKKIAAAVRACATPT